MGLHGPCNWCWDPKLLTGVTSASPVHCESVGFEVKTQVRTFASPSHPKSSKSPCHLPIMTDGIIQRNIFFLPIFPFLLSSSSCLFCSLLFVIFAHPRKIMPFQVAFYGLFVKRIGSYKRINWLKN